MTTERKVDVTEHTGRPDFGALAGVKVVHATNNIAAPFAAQLMAEYGADVIWIENPRFPDAIRTEFAGEQERRNQRTIALNIAVPEGREVLSRLLANADIFIESSRGGHFARWGLTDEVLWEWNPALVIAHVSGFGQDGLPEFVSKPSYDVIAQAFSGYMHQNGYPDRPPVAAFPYLADYFTGLFTCTSALAALHRARATGEGESIDVAQFEVMVRCQAWHMQEYLNAGRTWGRHGSKSDMYACEGVYECGDGKPVALQAFGAPLLKTLIEFLGLEYGSADLPDGLVNALIGSPGGDRLQSAVEAYCASKPAEQIAEELAGIGVPCTVVMDYPMITQHPHFLARDVFVEWEGVDGSVVKGVNVIPRFKKSPGQVWRGAPSIGMDNGEILGGLGFSQSEIAALYEAGVIRSESQDLAPI